MSEVTYDVAVIGAGPGGYVAAFRAAQLGLKTALVEKRSTLGGTCLNVGCIPSKALLHSTELLVHARDHGAKHGLDLGTPKVDLGQMMRHKDEVVERLVGGVALLAKQRKVDVHYGAASLEGDGKFRVQPEDGEAQVLSAKHIIIATGSVPVQLPFLPCDGENVLHSDHAIALPEIPEKLAVVGGGAIGLELGAVWSRLGSQVTVVEFLPKIAAGYDDDVTKLATRIFKKQGLTIEVGAKVTGYADGKLHAERGEKKLEIEADKVLVAVGRKPFTEGLGLDAIGLDLDEKGRIPIDGHFQTKVAGVYAIGDVVAGPMLAHKAEDEGIACVEGIAGQSGHVNYDTIPNVIYTEPEIASVGLGEVAAKEAGHPVRVGKFPMAANGRGIATDATDGFAKVIAHAETDRILGVQIVSKSASELIAIAATHMEYGGSAEDLGRTIHAHPTLSESLKEAGLAASGIGALHAK